MHALLTKLDALIDQQAQLTEGLHALAASVATLASAIAQESGDDDAMPSSLDEL